ncbi:hypothetical protein GQS52_18035 [Streptomyces sp. SCUT-3]|uniref:hypothetical protein n=1 Tax=Streptomyces sp. SCUT-3 TaxID=2684469 RepID=UPI0015F98AC8|nr:hypothetical protein [Streptomyces sp. SCUT-3]QMV23349.1 hypothetical protein GQS52_18035 [Streptomyces sp. SCUT-3]
MQRDWLGLQSTEYGIHEEREANSNYEVPEVREVQSCAPLTPSLLLVTAPAAVGKSTAAAYIGNLLKAPVLDLSRLQVGDATLEGSLAKSLGIRKNAEFSEALLNSNATLLIDALDEAEVRSGQANFRAFVRGLADTASQITGGPAIVVFSRAESARSLQEVFTERNLQYSHFEIQPFNEKQAENYLDRKVCEVYSIQGKEMVHRKYLRPYEVARDQLFKALASALTRKTENIWSEAAVREFLGYAPVLDVAAEYLAVGNFATLSKNIDESSRSGLAHWNLVANVIDQLLSREQDKFVQQFKETNEFQQHGNSSIEANLYSAEEQCARLLDYVENLLLDLDLPVTLPTELRDPYESAVEAQLVNHPFLRGDLWFNVIFRDYVTARSLTSPITPGRSLQAIRKSLLSSDWKHSPMFGYFSHALGAEDSEKVSSCHSEEIGALYESFKSMCESEDELHMTIGRLGNRLRATFVASRPNGDSVMRPLNFLSHEGTTTLSFPRELSHTDIWEVPEVILGGDHRSFKFGPRVYISCGDLMVSSNELQVYAEKEGLPVFIAAKSVTSDNVKIQVESADMLIVCDDELPFPWSRYRKDLDFTKLASEAREASALYLEFRRIVLRFKDAKRREAAVYQPMMDNLVIGTNKRARAVLEFLQHIGCVKLQRSMYLLDFSEFAKLGISRSQLRDLEETSAMGRISKMLLDFTK